MCGIYFSIYINNNNNNSVVDNNYSKTLLKNRGPNNVGAERILINNNNIELNFIGHVLWQQGLELYPQPVITEKHILLFNGDIYNFNNNNNNNSFKSENQSDTEFLSMQLEKCENELSLLELFKTIYGPYCIIYFNKLTNILYFMRDSLGRHSLLIGKYKNKENNNCIIKLTSVTEKNVNYGEFIELPSIGIFKCDLNNLSTANRSLTHLQLYPWQEISEHYVLQEQLQLVEEFLCEKIIIESTINPLWLSLFSDNNYIDNNYNFKDILSECNYNEKTAAEELFTYILHNKNVLTTVTIILNYLKQSIKDRISKTPNYCKNCINANTNNCKHSKIGILYSGGIDCTILALLCDEIMTDENDSIDLINVSFEKIKRQPNNNNNNKQKQSIEQINDCINFNTPDRISAKESLIELQKLRPNRKWNLIEINVTREQLYEAQLHRILHLIYPLQSILDESLGSALWFAASGKGLCNGILYESPCRIVLMGSGADELFGGYTRHRNAFLRESIENSNNNLYINLDNELRLDRLRLPYRNLGRDDRIISDYGVTLRTPFIEENLFNFIINLKSMQKCCHQLSPGIGDKLLLRLCGFKIGLNNVCSLKKRAIQFGCRIADSKQNAKDISTLSLL